MTIVRIVSVVPAMDKIGAMRSLLVDRFKSTPGTSLSVNVLGETATFVQTTVFDSLEAYEKFKDSESADPAILQHRGKVGILSRKPVTVRLLNGIVPPAESRGANLRYATRTIFQATPAGQDAVRDSLKAFAKTEQENGRQYFRMAELLFGHDGSALTLGDSFENLAEVENVNRSRAARIKVSRSEIGPLLRASPLQRLYEVLVPAD